MKPEHVVNIERIKEDRFKRPYVYRFSLPSNGILYGGKFPGGELYVAPMTASEEGLLGSQKSDKVSVIDTICKRCIVECPVAFEDLLVSDTFFLLMCIRNISYGSSYEFSLTCPNCATKYHRVVKIPDGLRVTRLSEEDDCEPYPVTLPMSGDTLGFRLLRNKDEESIRRYARSRYSKTIEEGDPSYCIRLATHIETINGEKVDGVKRLNYVEQMLAADSDALKEAISSRDFGASISLEGDCPACGYTSEEFVTFDRNFFRAGGAKS